MAITFYPEGTTSLPSDDAMRSLHKIVGLGGGGSGSGAQQVFAGNYGGLSPSTFGVVGTIAGSKATDLDAPYPEWTWDGAAWF